MESCGVPYNRWDGEGIVVVRGDIRQSTGKGGVRDRVHSRPDDRVGQVVDRIARTASAGPVGTRAVEIDAAGHRRGAAETQGSVGPDIADDGGRASIDAARTDAEEGIVS